MARELRENGIYEWRGEVFIAVAGEDGYALYTGEEWENDATADYEADAEGFITFQGNRIGGNTEQLGDTGQTA